MEPATTFQSLGLPSNWHGSLEWVFPSRARKHVLDKGEAVNLLKGAIVTADRIVTVSQVSTSCKMMYFNLSLMNDDCNSLFFLLK